MQLMVDIRAEQLLARLSGGTQRLNQNMLRVVTRLSIAVQAAVKDKLTGKVLHVRTGTLRRSINTKVEQTETATIATVGTNVAYAGVHEFGFNGIVNVREYVRNPPKNAAAKPHRRNLGRTTPSGAYGEDPASSNDPVTVRAHSRQMVMPERSYLRSTLVDFTPQIREELRAAAIQALLP